jgi:hypothetical protein
MSQSAAEIERVVREVLAEFGAAQPRADGPANFPSPSGRGAGGEGSQRLSPSALTLTVSQRERGPEDSLAPRPSPLALPPSPPAPSSANDLVLSARVVTMNEILGRLDSSRRVVVSREAIVTPAVRDELLRRGIALEYADSTNCRPTAVRLVLMIAGTEFDSAALALALAREGFCVESAALDCVIAAVDQLAAEIAKPDTLGILLSRHTAAGLCLANRLPAVRAITAADPPGVAFAAAAVGANVLVADPNGGSFFQLKQMITEFARGGVRPCPAVFRERLGT